MHNSSSYEPSCFDTLAGRINDYMATTTTTGTGLIDHLLRTQIASVRQPHTKFTFKSEQILDRKFRVIFPFDGFS